jgi:hypothetical protein
MTRLYIKRKIKRTIKAAVLGGACCTVIYTSLLLIAVKSILRMQTNPIDL